EEEEDEEPFGGPREEDEEAEEEEERAAEDGVEEERWPVLTEAGAVQRREDSGRRRMVVSILSWNADGLQNKGKLNGFMAQLRSDMVCLQETKWDEGAVREIERKWHYKVVVAVGPQGKADVAIMVKKHRVCEVTCVYKREEGRVLVVDVICDSQRIRLMSIHAPNEDSARRDFFTSLVKWCTHTTIIMGDWNVVLEKQDVGVHNKYGNDVSRKTVLNLMSAGKLVDVWRMLHPNITAFSRRQIILGKMKQSRIDFSLISDDLIRRVERCGYEFNRWSDHAAMTLVGGGQN
uniref:exodeoxyribonuclease III n=1 Tax=Mastacembelus armatus TaxID=205130 RepID=A0A7N9AS92_9TELE